MLEWVVFKHTGNSSRSKAMDIVSQQSFYVKCENDMTDILNLCRVNMKLKYWFNINKTTLKSP